MYMSFAYLLTIKLTFSAAVTPLSLNPSGLI